MPRFINPIPQYILANGDLAAGGSLTFYEFNTDTLLNIFADEDETTPIANPVTLGSRGEVPNIFFSVAARAVLHDADGNQVFDVQPTVSAGGGSGGVSGWSANTTYGQLSIVFGSDSEFYISQVNDNVGNDPVDDKDDSPSWSRLEFLEYWNDQKTYETGDLVVRGSIIYVSEVDANLGNNPSTDTLGNWKSLNDAGLSPYNNSASGLTSENTQSAIDELRVIINNITSPLTYMGSLNVSGGDGSLPVSPANGDTYVIGVGGTITVSVNGAAETSTAVTTGQLITWNNGESRWDLIPTSTQAASVSFSNLTSGLVASDVQTAIDLVDAQVDVNLTNITNLQSTVAGLGVGVVYRGEIDVSAGDSALPVAPSGGDLYGIAVGGTITVSSNGGAPSATAVTAGQQIIYNSDAVQWELLASVTSAGAISYDNNTSGLSAVTVQAALDEIDSAVDTIVAKDDVYFGSVNATATFTKQARLNDLTKTGTNDVILTLTDTSFASGDVVRVRKALETGILTVTTTNNQTLPDATTATSNFFPSGETGTVELVYNGSIWFTRIY